MVLSKHLCAGASKACQVPYRQVHKVLGALPCTQPTNLSKTPGGGGSYEPDAQIHKQAGSVAIRLQGCWQHTNTT